MTCVHYVDVLSVSDYINNLIKTEKEKKERSLVPSSVREELLHNVYQFLSGNPVVVDFNLTTG